VTAATPTQAAADPAILVSKVAVIQRTLEKFASELGTEIPEMQANDAQDAIATIVVVGEPKNGKSTLVNALVGRPGLSPVDYAVATATYIAIRHGMLAARVWPEGATASEEIDIDDLGAWTSLEGLAHNPRAPKVPRPVEVTLPAPFLEHISLIDTPGVGGFARGHDRATLTALAGATSLIFCADASRPLSQPELSFLAQATTAIAHVTFVLTKVDQESSWRDVLADNEAKIAERAPEFKGAHWFPVAAPLAKKSLDRSLPDAAAQAIRERSGIDALAAYLTTEVAGRAKALVAGNSIKELRSTAAYLTDRAEQQVELLADPSEEAHARISGEKTRLTALASLEDGWRVDLDLGLAALRTSKLSALNEAIQQIHDTATPLAEDMQNPPDVLSEAVNGAVSSASESVARELAAELDTRVRAIIGDEIETPAFAVAMTAAERSDEVTHLRETRDLVAEGRLQPAQQMPLVLTGTSGVSLTAMALTPILGAWALLPGVGLAIAASATAFMFARRQSRLNERRQWLQGRLAEAKVDLQTVIDYRINTAKALIARAVREWLRTRETELKTSIAELQAQINRDAQARAQKVTTARERATQLQKIVKSCDHDLDQLIGPTPGSIG
jgi:uncharacterized membrane protein